MLKLLFITSPFLIPGLVVYIVNMMYGRRPNYVICEQCTLKTNKIKCIISCRQTQTESWGLSFHKRRGPRGNYSSLLIPTHLSKIIFVWTFYFPFWVFQIPNHRIHVRGLVWKVTSHFYWEHGVEYNQHWGTWESTCMGKRKFEWGRKVIFTVG